ncbi:hypothetical protein BC830DRAFT_640876 [Chytriomyces sp. MP71]|nr:hypothetical protein BC830DRAFT_640876 [Chytriomyces sp. MP71]
MCWMQRPPWGFQWPTKCIFQAYRPTVTNNGIVLHHLVPLSNSNKNYTVNPCSCAFGNPCICGDLSLKKAKQAVAAAAPSHQHASETTPSLNLLRPVLPSFSTILNRGGSGVAAASSRTGAASLLPGVAALTSGLLAAPFDAPRLASCCGAGKPPVSVVPVADSAGTAARGTQDAAFVAQALLGLKEGPAGASAASLFSCSSSSLSSSDCMQECNIGDEEGNCGEEDEDAGGCGCGCSCVQESVLSSTGGGCCATKPVDEMVIGSPRAGCGSGGPDGGGSGCRC